MRKDQELILSIKHFKDESTILFCGKGFQSFAMFLKKRTIIVV